MIELTLHPNVYSTGHSKGLVSILERVWLREHTSGEGTLYIISGFANYNGGVRFYPTFSNHINKGGRVVAIFGGSARQNLSSKQVVTGLLECGAEVYIVNRKRLMHAKSYGSCTHEGQMLVVTSGNFTGPGMAQNVEISVLLDRPTTQSIGFSWENMIQSMKAQPWDFYQPTLVDLNAPAWQLLYDEQNRAIVLDESDEMTMILRLGHSDTVRINAVSGNIAGTGTQYFWLSRDCYDFFPALTILNERGYKKTYSCLIEMAFIDIEKIERVRVTFEAENNLDFRLGTGPLRYTGVAREGDLAAISRVGDRQYELRICRQEDWQYPRLSRYAVNFIGHRGKQYGFLSNQKFQEMTGIRVGRKLLF